MINKKVNTLDAVIRQGLETSQDCIGVLDPDDRVVFCNSTFASAYGIDTLEALGKTNKELLQLAWKNKKGIFIDTNDFEVWYQNILQVQKDKKHNQFETDFTDGRWFKMTRHNLDNGFVMLFGVDITDLKEAQASLYSANQKIEELANTDPLTGVNNRRSFERISAKEWERAKRYQQPLSILALDLDHFKRVNDTYGHKAGDDVLKQFSSICLQEVRKGDSIFRMGGEEFTVLMPMSETEDAKILAARLRSCTETTDFFLDDLGQSINISVSIGVSSLTHWKSSIEDIAAQADQALYSAKQSGRNQVIIYGQY